jgi:ribosomal protein S12 methylthiotransferase
MSTLPIVDPAATATCGAGSSVLPAVQAVDPATCRGTFAVVSLGCPKNLVDTERMLGLPRG